jgi:hypothetical protein
VITRFRKVKRKEFSDVGGTGGPTTRLKDNNKRIKGKEELSGNRGWSEVRTERVIGKVPGRVTHGVTGGAGAGSVLFFFFRFCRVGTRAVSETEAVSV